MSGSGGASRIEQRFHEVGAVRRVTCLSLLGLVVIAVVPGCGGDGIGPTTPGSVTVTSPVGDLVVLGGTVELTATALDAEGEPMPVSSFAWESSSPAALAVDANGSVTAVDLGASTVTASTAGVRGSIRLEVVDADVESLSAMTADVFAEALVAGLGEATQTIVEPAWERCASAAGDRNLRALQDCVAEIRSESASATDGTDRALLSVLDLFADEIERDAGL